MSRTVERYADAAGAGEHLAHAQRHVGDEPGKAGICLAAGLFVSVLLGVVDYEFARLRRRRYAVFAADSFESIVFGIGKTYLQDPVSHCFLTYAQSAHTKRASNYRDGHVDQRRVFGMGGFFLSPKAGQRNGQTFESETSDRSSFQGSEFLRKISLAGTTVLSATFPVPCRSRVSESRLATSLFYFVRVFETGLPIAVVSRSQNFMWLTQGQRF